MRSSLKTLNTCVHGTFLDMYRCVAADTQASPAALGYICDGFPCRNCRFLISVWWESSTRYTNELTIQVHRVIRKWTTYLKTLLGQNVNFQHQARPSWFNLNNLLNTLRHLYRWNFILQCTCRRVSTFCIYIVCLSPALNGFISTVCTSM